MEQLNKLNLKLQGKETHIIYFEVQAFITKPQNWCRKVNLENLAMLEHLSTETEESDTEIVIFLNFLNDKLIFGCNMSSIRRILFRILRIIKYVVFRYWCYFLLLTCAKADFQFFCESRLNLWIIWRLIIKWDWPWQKLNQEL